jgi:hypothetical protein
MFKLFSPPEAYAVRRDGGRYGWSPARQAQVEGGIRSRLRRISVLPAAVMALLGAATVVYVLAASADPVSGTTCVVLTLAVAGCAVVLFVAAGRADGLARTVDQRVDALRSSTVRGQAEVQRLLEQLQSGERPVPRDSQVPPVQGGDIFARLEHDLTQAQLAAQAAVVQASALTPAGRSGQQVEVFVNLARRLQSLVHREIQLLDELENEVEDPDLLKGLFDVDHLATRMRRHAENLAVLGGAMPRRQWSRPVALIEVLRSAIAEVEHYSRVKLVQPIEGTLRGHAVADVIHLVAELVENATNFSTADTQVLLRAQYVTAGLAIEVEDRGLGMSLVDQYRANNLLDDSDRIDIGEVLRDGRIGLFVVSAIAHQHGIAVRLQTNIYGGIQAVIILPHGLLGEALQDREQPTPSPAPDPLPAEVPIPAFGHSTDPGQMEQPGLGESPQRLLSSAPTIPTVGPATHHAADSRVRPQLPRRRAQTHLAPQLQQPPAAQGEGPVVGHDPGLMAAFMRGVSLAETGADEEDGLPGGADSTR